MQPVPDDRQEAVDDTFKNMVDGVDNDATTRRLELSKWDRIVEALIPGYTAGDHRFSHGVEVEVCGENQTFEHPRVWHRYLSMITLTRLRGPIAHDLKSFREQRRATFRTLTFGLIICFFAKYSMQVCEVLSRCFEYRYMQLWNGSRTRYDRTLESVMLHGVAILFTLAMQISMCTVYLQFWRTNHFVMYFIPTLGFRLFLGTLVMLFIADFVDRIGNYSIKWTARKVYAMWLLALVWLGMIAIPMVGYSVTSIQFLVELNSSGWLKSEDDLFGEDFEQTALKATGACALFCAIAIVDITVILFLDLETHSSNRNMSSMAITPHNVRHRP